MCGERILTIAFSPGRWCYRPRAPGFPPQIFVPFGFGDRTKMFHVKLFGTIGEAEYARASYIERPSDERIARSASGKVLSSAALSSCANKISAQRSPLCQPAALIECGTDITIREIAIRVGKTSMILEFLASYPPKKLLDGILDKFRRVRMNRRTFNIARSELRSKYEDKLQPANYNSVVSSLRLSRDDFIKYFQMPAPPGTLNDHLRNKLIERFDAWIFHRPRDALFSELVDDFLNAYLRVFPTTDPTIRDIVHTYTSKKTPRKIDSA